MKRFFFCYLKSFAIIAMLLFVIAKTNAQWIELGGANGTAFPTDYTGGNYIRTIATDAAGNVYAGSVIKQNPFYYYFVAKWNGTAWSALGGVTFNGLIQSIATDKGGNVYAGGNFTDANNKGFIAKWNGTSWSELSGENDSLVNGYIDHIATDASGNVYVAGTLHDANGFYVAKWNGTAWSKLGGANGSVFNNVPESIAIDASGNVYVGYFTNVGNNYYVAKWNGTTWNVALGGVIFNGPISSIATDTAGNVYAGGNFADYNANGYYVAKWNGTAWSELGGAPFGYYITSVTTDAEGNVYAGGNFGDNTGNHFVNKWNGTTWSELGGAPFNFAINTIAVSANGNVYTGGNFTDSNHYYYVAEYVQSILPVTLVSFTTTTENKDVVIKWATTHEINTAYFNLQRSTDGTTFKTIGKVNAKASTSNINDYIYKDDITQIQPGKAYYRLQMTDEDGRFTYSNVRYITIDKDGVNIVLLPNPAHSYFIVRNNSNMNLSEAMLTVKDITGHLFITRQLSNNPEQNINISSLAKGVYIINIYSSGYSHSEKLIVQ